MPITVARSPCWRGKSAIHCRSKPCSACGSGDRARADPPFCVSPFLITGSALVLLLSRSGTIQLRGHRSRSAMRKGALVDNPDSGGSSERRKKELESAVALLQAGGVDAELIPTESRDHAEDETRQAIHSGCDTIFACGGDGTVHSIAQVLATTQVQLAILPMGTANALAHDIGLPFTIVGAAEAALRGVARRVAVGRVDYFDLEHRPASRYFVVTAGVGVDAHLFYKLHAGTKRRMGMAAYYAKAWNLWLTYPMTWFKADYVETGSQEAKRAEVTELMGVRIRNFGGVLQELAPGASLERDDMRLVFCRTASRLACSSCVTLG